MKLSEQVCSLELAKKLKELGFEQKSIFQWKQGIGDARLILSDKVRDELFSPSLFDGLMETAECKTYCSAYTVSELGEMLMLHKERNEENNIISIIFENSQCLDKDCDCGGTENFTAVMMIKGERKHVEMDYPSPIYTPSEANVRAKMLIYLKENNLLL